jgi:hypothetical protein
MFAEYFKESQSTNKAPTWATTITPGGQYTEYYDPLGAVTFTEYYDLTTDPWELDNLHTPPDGWAARLTTDRSCSEAACP